MTLLLHYRWCNSVILWMIYLFSSVTKHQNKFNVAWVQRCVSKEIWNPLHFNNAMGSFILRHYITDKWFAQCHWMSWDPCSFFFSVSCIYPYLVQSSALGCLKQLQMADIREIRQHPVEGYRMSFCRLGCLGNLKLVWCTAGAELCT